MTNGSTMPRADGCWPVDFDRFGATIEVALSFIGRIGATDVPGGLALWASDTKNDASGSGTLLCDATGAPAGTAAAFVGIYGLATVANPGGKRFVTLVSRAGSLASVAVTLDYERILNTMVPA